MNIKEFIRKNNNLNVEEYLLNNTGVVYFICDHSDQIIYVGKTLTNLGGRVNSHNKRFSIKSIYYVICPKNKIKEMEQKFIAETNPKNNKNGGRKLGINIKLMLAYKRKGLKQHEAAAKSGIERTRFSRIVTGHLRPRENERRNISKAVSVSQKKLFGIL